MRTLADDYFLEAFGFDTAKRIGGNIGRSASKEGRAKLKDVMNTARNTNATSLKDAVSKGSAIGNAGRKSLKTSTNVATQQAGKIGSVVGQAALGATYVGAAYLAYKGLMKLKDKFSKSNNPQEKQNLQKQIDAGQNKLKRSKDIEAVKKKQASEKRQRDAQRK